MLQVANKMTLDQWFRNNRGIGVGGADLPQVGCGWSGMGFGGVGDGVGWGWGGMGLDWAVLAGLVWSGLVWSDCAAYCKLCS